jgi:pyruvate dehydrogenase E2 component (dihydrolipoamide acetyltransferase)
MSATNVIMPKLGLTMDEGRLIAWHKQEGDRVTEGEVLFEVETDKAAMEVPATTSGFLRRVLAKADDMIPVAQVVAVITTTADEPVAAATPVAPAAPPERVAASPAARKRAQELGVDLATLVASKPGRISIEDVEAAATSAPAAAGETRVPLSRMRKAIATAMSRSSAEAPQFKLERDIDMTRANEQRKRAGASYTDVVVSAVARALAAHPRLRSRFDGDAIVERAGAHVGLAVAVDDGLLVPVIRDADRKDLAALAKERERIEAAARSGHLGMDDLSGAVISVSNLGSFGVDRFTAIVNPPEAAIVAMGHVRDRVVATRGGPAVRLVVTLTLSVDHRVADGAEAARYLEDVAKLLEAGE